MSPPICFPSPFLPFTRPLRFSLRRVISRSCLHAPHTILRGLSTTLSRAPLKRQRRQLAVSNPPAATLPPGAISLNSRECKIRQLLLDVAASIRDSNPMQKPLTLRLVGGWVRDKLLGGECHDIDVCVDRMTGYQFAKRLSRFAKGRQKQYGITDRLVVLRIVHKTKRMETALTNILGISMDFIQLSKAVDDDGNSLGIGGFGTPEDDARRRDACINALYYNLHTKQVEDFSGRGLDDLNARIIRAPRPPLPMFLDDPVRVLRFVRFAGRLDFTIEEEAQAAMQNPEVRRALRFKASRARVGMEVTKMLSGPNPELTLSLMHHLGLYDCVFMPQAENPPELPLENLMNAISIVSYLQGSGSRTDFAPLFASHKGRYTAWLLAALTPWGNKTTPGKQTGCTVPAVASVLKQGLQASNSLSLPIIKAFENYAAIQRMVQKNAIAEDEVSRGHLVKLLRTRRDEWMPQTLLAFMLECSPVWKLGRTGPGEEAQEMLEKYGKFFKRIREMGFGKVRERKRSRKGRKG